MALGPFVCVIMALGSYMCDHIVPGQCLILMGTFVYCDRGYAFS